MIRLIIIMYNINILIFWVYKHIIIMYKNAGKILKISFLQYSTRI